MCQSEKIVTVFISVKAIEAWFLADSKALSKWLKKNSISVDYPELTIDLPWERLKEIAKENKARDPEHSKPNFAKKYINHFGFSVEVASQHSNCPSAKEFYDKLVDWGSLKKNLSKPN